MLKGSGSKIIFFFLFTDSRDILVLSSMWIGQRTVKLFARTRATTSSSTVSVRVAIDATNIQCGHQHSEKISLFFILFLGNPTLCRQITNMPNICDVKWATQNCSLTFQTIGAWPENADGTDVNAVCLNADANILASGDDFGRVKLFTYPTIQPKVS